MRLVRGIHIAAGDLVVLKRRQIQPNLGRIVVMKIEELKEEIERRKAKEPEIRKAIDLYCEAHYGISGFSATVQEIFTTQKNFGLCIGRQIPTASIELLALEPFTLWLGRAGIVNEAMPLAFLNDSLGGSTESALKRSYYRLPFLRRGKNGLYCQNQNLVGKTERGNLTNLILHCLQTEEGHSLVKYHYELYGKALGEERFIIDISPYFLKFLKASIKQGNGKPECVYVREGDYERRIQIYELDGQPLNRPPAEWYYLFHLLMYVDGQRALLFGVGDDDKFVKMFQRSIDKVREITGFEPIIIYIPDHIKTDHYISEHLTEIPAWVLDDREWLSKVSMPDFNYSLFDAYTHFERQLIELA